jgi:hypothetical protein
MGVWGQAVYVASVAPCPITTAYKIATFYREVLPSSQAPAGAVILTRLHWTNLRPGDLKKVSCPSLHFDPCGPWGIEDERLAGIEVMSDKTCLRTCLVAIVKKVNGSGNCAALLWRETDAGFC